MHCLQKHFKNGTYSDESDFSILNANIRSINKNLDKLTECIETMNHDFTIIGLSETHLKDKPHEYYHLNGHNIEYTNQIGHEKGGVCLYISDKMKYKLRKDLCTVKPIQIMNLAL